ncbi:hypothetical protein JW998_11105 [candidate division KSB1 bacterium]|nr:hypothetical protein [candidate division KSB1 bacterium]
MSEITLEKNHALLEKLAEYMMNELPTRSEVDAKLAQLREELRRTASKEELAQLREELSRTASKEELTELRIELTRKASIEQLDKLRVEMNQKLDQLLQGQDAQAGQLADLRLEMAAVSKTLDVYNDRLGALEEHNFGTRVRDVTGSGDERSLAE